jgi:hypothetical protein
MHHSSAVAHHRVTLQASMELVLAVGGKPLERCHITV